MNEELQRIKIAEACGWTDFSRAKHEGAIQYGRKPLSYSDSWEVPDYLNDLNAMHEAERVLNRNQQNTYINILDGMPDYKCPVHHDFQWCCSTAAQRAEAFLKTFGLWEES